MLLNDSVYDLMIIIQSSWDNTHNCNVNIGECNLHRGAREEKKTGG